MKVGIIIGNLEMGGLQKVTTQVANSLSKHHSVELIVLYKNDEFYDINERVAVKKAKINYPIWFKVLRKLFRITKIPFKLQTYKEEQFLSQMIMQSHYNVVIASDGLMSIFLNDSKFDRGKTKVINWLHNEYDTYFNNYFKEKKKQLAESLSSADVVVTLTNSDKEEYQIHNTNTVYIYNPVTINQSETSNLLQKEILFVARLAREQKGLDYLIEVANKIKHTNWIIRVLGEGPDKEWFEKQIIENNLQDIIILEGSVKENIEKYYANASLFISTSRWEGFGLVVTEAMSSGLPVIAFENKGPTEILDNGKYGILIPKYNTDLFAKELIKLIENKEELLRYQQLSLQRSQDFTVEKIMQEWEALINEQ